jgi:hypothetical protein
LAAVLVLVWLAFVRGGKVPVLGLVDLGFHELGHLVTYPFPDLATAMAGSLFQILVPVGLACYFSSFRGERAAGALCLAWAATSVVDVAAYIADAPFEKLPLIGGQHDWAFALGPDGFDALDHAGDIAAVVRGFGWALAALAIGHCLVSLLSPAWKRARTGGGPVHHNDLDAARPHLTIKWDDPPAKAAPPPEIAPAPEHLHRVLQQYDVVVPPR